MLIKSIKLDLINKELFSLQSPALSLVETLLDEKDSYSEQFLLKPLRPVSDTKNYGDIIVEWSRDLENTFTQICRFPITPVSIIQSPLKIEYKVHTESFKLAVPFKMRIDVINTNEVPLDFKFELS